MDRLHSHMAIQLQYCYFAGRSVGRNYIHIYLFIAYNYEGVLGPAQKKRKSRKKIKSGTRKKQKSGKKKKNQAEKNKKMKSGIKIN